MNLVASFCSTADCSYSIDSGSISCSPGGDSCTGAILQRANLSAFHTSGIKDVTDEINKELEKLGKNPPEPGLQLSFLWTPSGVLLVWTKHEDTYSGSGVKRSDGKEANDKALGICAPEQAS
ncbi:MAG: hypothetical protein DMF62_15245 [Acidobacteria bacterium]|nr:MAG: hypothetical protein DMF62_15245 [Acidobacteriota bacterium]